MNKYDVSVIIALYNAEEYMGRCIESLLNQTLSNIEIICVNDGSTDRSRQIIEQYSNTDKRIKLINQENNGAASARNAGLKLAQGEYVIFLDADDFFEEDMLEKAFKKISETESDICIFDSYEYDVNTGNRDILYGAIEWEYIPDESVFSYKNVKENIFQLCKGWAWDKLYRRKFVIDNNLKFQEIRSSNDLLFVYMSMIKADKITVIKEHLINHTVNISSSLSMTRDKKWDCFYEAASELRNRLIISGLYEEVKCSFMKWVLDFSLWNYFTIGRYHKERVYNCIKHDIIKKWELDKQNKSLYKNESQYELMMDIVQYDINDFDIMLKISSTQKKLEKLEQDIQRIENKNQEYKNELEERIDYECKLIEEKVAVRNELEYIKNSLTYKIGSVITYIPRHIATFIKK